MATFGGGENREIPRLACSISAERRHSVRRGVSEMSRPVYPIKSMRFKLWQIGADLVVDFGVQSSQAAAVVVKEPVPRGKKQPLFVTQ